MRMRYRAPVLDDAPAVLAVLAARELADLGTTIRRLDDLRDEWQATELELDRDARVVEVQGGRIVAYVGVRRYGTLAVVAPDHEGRGSGARLLEWAERREREKGHSFHRQWVAGANASARGLLTRAGYTRARSYRRLTRLLDEVGPAPAVPVLAAPAGVRLRPVDVARDALALHALDAASFADALDNAPESPETFRREHLEAHDFDPELSLVAERGDEVVAFLLAHRREAEGAGFVAILAVKPEHQRQGIGTALVQHAFAGFAAAGLWEAQLMVASDNPRALRVYEQAGMAVKLEFDIYERPAGSA